MTVPRELRIAILAGFAAGAATAAAVFGLVWSTVTATSRPDETGFPEVTVLRSTGGAAGGVLTLALEDTTDAASSYVAAVDNRGEVLWSRRGDTGLARTFKRLPDGRFLINQYVGHRYPPIFGLAQVLDANLERVAIVSPRPPVNGGYGHDIQITSDGNFLVTANSPRRDRTRPHGVITNPLIQEISPSGDVVWQWDGYDHRDSMAWAVDCVDAAEIPDWAHINSLYLTEDGDVLASFRHCHHVLKIDRSGRTGRVEWKIGGSEPEVGTGIRWFRVTGDPYGTFCGQHAASLSREGNLLLFDNGTFETSLERNPANPGRLCPSRRVVRGENNQSRAVEYVLQRAEGVATYRRSFPLDRRHGLAVFQGAVTELENGHWLISWGHPNGTESLPTEKPTVTEIDPATGEVHLSLAIHRDGAHYSTYRAYRAPRSAFPEPR